MFSQRTSRKNCWMTPCSIGPRQMTGASSPVRNAIETTLMPYCSAGTILLAVGRELGLDARA